MKPNSESGSATTEGIFRSSALWAGGTASVCFAESSASSNDVRYAIKQIVEKEINRVTRFRFTGFKMCKEGYADITASVGLMGRSRSTVGDERNLVQKIFYHGSPTRGDVDLFLQGDDGVSYSALEFHNVVVHEFGHALGLEHEQLRADSKCTDQGGGVGEPPRSVKHGKYDADSIMDYCNAGYFNRRLSLSAGDVATINAMYAGSNAGANTGQLIRCDKPRVIGCFKNNGGESCVTTYCKGGEYVCRSASLLKSCAKAKGGLACFGESHGNCGG